MSRGFNTVQLLGNLGKDPEIRTLENSNRVATFSIATTKQYRDKVTNEKKELTDWHNIVAWSGLADIVEKYVKKGSKVFIEGKLRTRSWDDQDGKKQYRTEVIAGNIILLSSLNGSEPTFESQEQNEGGDDLPF